MDFAQVATFLSVAPPVVIAATVIWSLVGHARLWLGDLTSRRQKNDELTLQVLREMGGKLPPGLQQVSLESVYVAQFRRATGIENAGPALRDAWTAFYTSQSEFGWRGIAMAASQFTIKGGKLVRTDPDYTQRVMGWFIEIILVLMFLLSIVIAFENVLHRRAAMTPNGTLMVLISSVVAATLVWGFMIEPGRLGRRIDKQLHPGDKNFGNSGPLP